MLQEVQSLHIFLIFLSPIFLFYFIFVCTVHSDAFQGPLDFTFQDVWLQLSDHTIVNIRVVKIFFVQFFCVFSPPLLNIFWLLGPYCSCPLFIVCMKCSLSISNFLEKISSLSHSIVFLYFCALFTLKRFAYLSMFFSGTLHSDGYIFPFLRQRLLFPFQIEKSTFGKVNPVTHGQTSNKGWCSSVEPKDQLYSLALSS